MNASQTAVYEEFARSIPGFQPPPAGETIATPPLPKPVQYEHGIVGNIEVSVERTEPVMAAISRMFLKLSTTSGQLT